MAAIVGLNRPKELPINLAGADTAGQYETPHPIHPTFKVVFRAITMLNDEIRKMRIGIDFSKPTGGKDDGKGYVGVFTVRLDKQWAATVNWTEEWKGSLAPDYIGIDFGGSSAGILGPWADIRTCWHCKLTGYRDPQKTLPYVIPGQACPKCGSRDWWAMLVSQVDLRQAASVALADVAKKPHLFDYMGGTDADLQKQGAHLEKYDGLE